MQENWGHDWLVRDDPEPFPLVASVHALTCSRLLQAKAEASCGYTISIHPSGPGQVNLCATSQQKHGSRLYGLARGPLLPDCVSVLGSERSIQRGAIEGGVVEGQLSVGVDHREALVRPITWKSFAQNAGGV